MLSIPCVPPRDNLWTFSPTRNTDLPTSDTPPFNASHPNASHNHSPQRPSTLTTGNPARSQLAVLLAEEIRIDQRKQNVRRFGATWLRPPGVSKTYQALMDEEIERMEQLEMARREAQMLELQEAAETGAEAVTVDGAGEQEEMEERDLDAEVPDADADADLDADEDEDEEDEEDEDDEGADGTTGFVEESFLEGSLVGGDGIDPAEALSFLEAEDAELDGRLQDERDLGLERDLDDDIPDAGSYQHTDTEVEDESSDVDTEEMQLDQSPRLPMLSGNQSSLRNSFGRGTDARLSGGSSDFESSSPAVGRGGQSIARGNAWRNRMFRARWAR